VKLTNSTRLRVIAPLVWLGVVLTMRWLDDGPLPRALLPFAAVYACYSAAITGARRRSVRPLRLIYAIPLGDVPMMGVLGLVWGHVSGASDWPCGATTALCALFTMLAVMALDARVLTATTVAYATTIAALFTHFHQPWSRLAFGLW
jgi:hypothetical protein